MTSLLTGHIVIAQTAAFSRPIPWDMAVFQSNALASAGFHDEMSESLVQGSLMLRPGLGFDEDSFTKVGLLQTLHQTTNGKASQLVVTLGCNGACIPYELTSSQITHKSQDAGL